MPNIDTLVEDIYNVVGSGKEPSEDNLEGFLSEVREIATRLVKEVRDVTKPKPFYLRMSNIGYPDRKLWLMKRNPQISDIEKSDLIKFAYGHMIEALLLFLVKETDHSVTHTQHTVEIEGVEGHTDCVIDDVPIDVKSASRFAFKKFKEGTLAKNDSFGYIAQISSYAKALGKSIGKFLVMNKESGELCLTTVDQVDMIDPKDRILHVKQMLDNPIPPPVCYQPVPQSSSSPNLMLDKNCSMCQHKGYCWPNVRVFEYASGPVELVHVVNEPKVKEITSEKVNIERD